MAQYRNLAGTIRSFPYYIWKEDKTEAQKIFINSLKLGEIFIYSSYFKLDNLIEQCKTEGVIIDKYEFKMKTLKKQFRNVAIVLQKGEEMYKQPIEDAQTFDPNSIFKEKGV